MKIYSILFLLFSAMLTSTCNRKGNGEAALFEIMKGTGISFVNEVHDNDTINILNYRNFYNGGGVAVGDINNDGLPDIFFTANQGSNKLYLNKGNWKYEDISTSAGFTNKKQFSTGTVFADINDDGWLDIFVCNAGSMNDASLRSNQLYINNRNLTFTESAAKYGLSDSGYTTQVSFFDYDLDGDLDCFKIDNSPVPVSSIGNSSLRDLAASKWKVEDYLKGGGDHLYRNDNGFFTEVTQEAGIHGSLMSFGLGVTVGDINGDHYPDIFVSNDFFERDYLYINQRNGTFKDELESRVRHLSYASMGADIGDINNDGLPEIFTTDMLPADDYRLKTTLSFYDIDQYRLKEKNGFYHQFLQNTLQLNVGGGEFEDIANYSGVNASEWSWGALMFDADNDGLSDLFVCNGIYHDLTNQDFLEFDANLLREQMVTTGQKDLKALVRSIPSIAVPNKMFRNLGNLKFSDEGANWGFDQNSFSNGSAYSDLDNDGDLDLVINNVNEEALIFRNHSREENGNNYISIELKGKPGNRFAVGSKILVYAGGQILSREIMPSRGFQSSVDYKQVIGLGKAKSIDSLSIVWPDLTVSKVADPVINKAHVFNQESSTGFNSGDTANHSPIFLEVKTEFDRHAENNFTDFYYERAIPQMLSQDGPKAAIGDINSDGLDDVFVGGTVLNPGQLYLQNKAGQFVKSEQPGFKSFSDFEDGPSLFFDCDGDSDLDLFVGAAGNEAAAASRQLQHRLFLNDGKGNFTISASAFPLNKDNIGVARVNDFDGDGDLDLFVGARCVTGQYGITPVSHIYLNDGKGKFSDMPAESVKGISNAGMVTDAVWADIAGDQKKELVIVGEWMYPKVFGYNNGKFEEIKTVFSDLHGWWLSVHAADLNGDGKLDLVLGNLGENFYLHASESTPLKLWISDFDENGIVEKFITRTIDNADKPVIMKREMQEALPSLKKGNLRHEEYAKRSIQELFTEKQLKKAEVKKVNYLSSIVALNQGQGKFDIKPLPLLSQLSSIRAIVSLDVNGDKFTDLVLGGNEFNFQPQYGRLDANRGQVLLNDGRGNFSVISAGRSGLNLTGMTRNIALINKSSNLLFLQCNEFPRLYKITNEGRGDN